MKAVSAYCLLFGLIFFATMVVHDIFVFAEVRGEIDRRIAHLTPSEVHPSPLVRAAFKLDSPSLYWGEAFDLYRYESDSRDWAHFDADKILATPIWMLELWVWYDRPAVEALRLRSMCCSYISARGADGIAMTAFGRGLNDLSPDELECVVKLSWTGSARRGCYAIGRLVPGRPKPTPS